MARVLLPRPGDGGRLLRFLTGLAVLALLLTAHLSGPVAGATAAPAPPAAATARSAATVTVAEQRPAVRPVRIEPAVAARSLPLAALIVVLTAVAWRIRPTRAPPA